MIFWLSVTFASFGLYAPRNATVVAVLFVAAVSVAAAVFLILELDGPFDGLIKVSSGPFDSSSRSSVADACDHLARSLPQ